MADESVQKLTLEALRSADSSNIYSTIHPLVWAIRAVSDKLETHLSGSTSHDPTQSEGDSFRAVVGDALELLDAALALLNDELEDPSAHDEYLLIDSRRDAIIKRRRELLYG